MLIMTFYACANAIANADLMLFLLLNANTYTSDIDDANVVFQRRIQTDGTGLLHANNFHSNQIRHAFIGS